MGWRGGEFQRRGGEKVPLVGKVKCPGGWKKMPLCPACLLVLGVALGVSVPGGCCGEWGGGEEAETEGQNLSWAGFLSPPILLASRFLSRCFAKPR